MATAAAARALGGTPLTSAAFAVDAKGVGGDPADPAWLAGRGRAYPLTVSVVVQAAATTIGVDADDTYVMSGVGDQSSSPDLQVGTPDGAQTAGRAYFHFGQLATRLRNQYINGASLVLLNNYATSCAPAPVTVFEVASPWSGSSLRWPGVPVNATYDTRSFAHRGLGGGCAAAWEALRVDPDAATRWTHGASFHGLGVRASNERDTAGFKRFAAAESANPPYLDVTYAPEGAAYQTDELLQPTNNTPGRIRVSTTNLGSSTWQAGGGYRLGLTVKRGGQVVAAPAPVAPAVNVAPMGVATIDLTIPPLAPDEYTLEIGMVNPQGQDFTGAYGVPKGTTPMKVTNVRPAVNWRCVDLDGYGRANGTAVQLWDCHAEWNQHVTVPGDGTLRVGGKCLDGDGPATGDPGDQRIKLWECNGLPFQQFVPRPDGSLYYPLTGRCVDAPSSDNGAKLYLHACHGAANQRFSLPVRAPAGALRSDRPARLVAHLPMDETSGTTAADASGMGHRAFLTTGAGWGQGQRGNALLLDGSAGSAATGSPVVQTTRSFSVAAWVRPTRPPTAWYGVVAQDDAVHSGFAIETSPDRGRWEFIVWPNRDTGDAKVVQSTTGATANQWVHLVATYDQPNEKMRIYVNGQFEAETTLAPQATGPTSIGRTKWQGAGANHFPGQIDDVRLFEGLLSDAEIAELGRAAG